jgi:membrane glycosyltransferase
MMKMKLRESWDEGGVTWRRKRLARKVGPIHDFLNLWSAFRRLRCISDSADVMKVNLQEIWKPPSPE